MMIPRNSTLNSHVCSKSSRVSAEYAVENKYLLNK